MLTGAGATRTFVGVLVAVCAGCSDSQSPAQPTPPAVPERPQAQYSLVGAVRDTAYQPVAGVRIEVLDRQRAGAFAVTDAVGRYELPGSFAGAMLVRASKDGYVSTAQRHDPSLWSQERQQLVFTLDLSSPSVNLTGRYTLTLAADDACTRLPAEVRTRRYPTSIALQQRASDPHQYEAEVSGATFLASPLVGRFHISVAGTFGYFYLGDPYDWGDAIVEELAPSTYLAIWGIGGLSVAESPIAGALSYGGFEFCVSSTSPVANGTYRCPAEALSCGLQRLELVRQ